MGKHRLLQSHYQAVAKYNSPIDSDGWRWFPNLNFHGKKRGKKKHCPQWRNDLGGAVREENDTAGLKSNGACSNGAVDCWPFSTHDFLY